MSAGHPTPGALPDRNLVNAGQIFDAGRCLRQCIWAFALLMRNICQGCKRAGFALAVLPAAAVNRIVDMMFLSVKDHDE